MKRASPEKPTIFIASKPGRGSGEKWPIRDGHTRIDVTSANTRFRQDLSPLFVGPTTAPDNTVFDRFENAWQYSKVYPQLGHWDETTHQETQAWLDWRKKGQTKLRSGKGIRTDPKVSKLKKIWRETGADWTPRHARWGKERLSYIEARKKIYVPEYIKLIEHTPTIKLLTQRYQNGESFLFLDLDGPPRADYPQGMAVTKESLSTMLNDDSHLFGHGYCIAAVVAGLKDELLESLSL